MLNQGELGPACAWWGRKTIELMTSNHLRGDMAAMGMPRFSESSYEGIGFGLGFSVMLDPARAQIVGTPGEYAWGGGGEHGVLDRPDGGTRRGAADAADAVLGLPDPAGTAGADLRGAGVGRRRAAWHAAAGRRGQ